ncbi:MAG: ferrochelatase, partial [Propionibacteriaceae bacterium]|nr:ferrochelatase [Propionibacteriaceae bacterium]
MPPNSPAAAVGVVLANLGTPDEPTLPAVQRYLREFLSDRRIVDLSPVIWKPILETSIMHGHAKLSTAKYASVWYPDGSPLLVHARAQAAAVAAALGAQCVAPGVREEIVTPDVSVAAGAGVAVGAGSAGDLGAAGAGGPGSRVSVTYGMRYGTPSLATALDTLRAAGAGRLLIVPLYPQFSTTTTATVIDALGAWCREAWDLPELRWVRSWATDAGYVEACARRIEACWEEWGRPDFARGDKLLLSYHGIPVTYVAAGDPYPRECEATTDLLRA